MKISSYELTTAEQEGRWFDALDAHTQQPVTGVQVLVASLRNEKYQHAIERFAERINGVPGRRQRKISTAEKKNIIRDAVAEYLLLDWKGFENDDGTVLEPSLINRRKALEKDKFFEMIYRFAEDEAAFLEEERGN